MSENLDELDRKILDLLQQDATLSTGDIAERVGLSQSPCWRRIRRLEETGVIARRTALLDPRKLGFPVLLIVQVKMRPPTPAVLEAFEGRGTAHPAGAGMLQGAGRKRLCPQNRGAVDRGLRGECAQPAGPDRDDLGYDDDDGDGHRQVDDGASASA